MTGDTDGPGGCAADLPAAYISMWNERNPRSRQSIGAEVFTPDAYYVDPDTSAQGRRAIDTYVAGWQERFPGFVFTLGEVTGHHDVAHFGWTFGPPGGPPAASGVDVLVIEQDRISRVCGFFD